MKVSTSFLIEPLFFLLIFASTICFGSVFPWGYWALSSGLFLMLLLNPPNSETVSSLPKFTKISFLIVAFGILVQIMKTSQVSEATSAASVRWLSLAGAFLLIQSFSSSRPLRRLLLGAALLGAPEAFYGLYQVLTGEEQVLWHLKENYQGFVTGTYFNRNHFAGLLELLMGLQMGFLLEAISKKKISRVFFWGMIFLVSAVAFLKSGSRMGMISFGIALLAGLFLLSGRLEKKWIALGLILWITIFGLAGRPVLLRVLDFDTWQSSGQGRLWVWQGTLSMILQHPWMGTGLGSYEWVFPAYQPAQSTLFYPHAHQDYLELLATLGIPLALALFAGFVCLITDIVRSLKESESFFYMKWGCFTGIFSLLVHGLADFNFAIPANLFVFLFLVAAAYRLCTLSKEGAE